MRSVRNRFLKSSISTRITIVFSVTFGLCISLAFLISYIQIDYALEETSKQIVSSKFQEDAAILSTQGIQGLKTFLEIDENRASNVHFLIQVLDQEGKTVFVKTSVQEEKFNFPSRTDKPVNLKAILGWHVLSAIDDEDKFDMYAEPVSGKYVLLVGRSSENRDDLLTKILNVFSVTALIFTVLACAVGIFAARNILAPIRDLLTTIKEIEVGDLSRRVSTQNSWGELRDLGDTFNRMIGRIEKLVAVMKESLDNVAHDIRTPLTRIKVVAEDALTSKQPGAFSLALEDCAESATTISELVDQLLSVSEADAGALKLTLSDCLVQPLIAGVAEIYDFVAQGQEVAIQTNFESPSLEWNFDRKRISQVIANLIDNAIKFSPPQTVITVSSRIINDHLQISICDQGQGISVEDLPKIWDRLFRGDKSRSTPGLGLGLSIVRAVVLAHGGTVYATKNPDSGMTFTIELPRSKISRNG